MPIKVETNGDGFTRATLTGRIDLAGAQDIDMPLSLAANMSRTMIADLSGVDFMASLGLRSLVIAAKAIARRNGRMVLLAPQPDVEEIIRTTGVDELIPIVRTEAEAQDAIKLG